VTAARTSKSTSRLMLESRPHKMKAGLIIIGTVIMNGAGLIIIGRGAVPRCFFELKAVLVKHVVYNVLPQRSVEVNARVAPP
jgi:hypothetical protein